MTRIFQLLCIVFLVSLIACDTANPAQEQALEEANAKIQQLEMDLQTAQNQTDRTGFIHTVFFWLKPDLTAEEIGIFEKGLRSLGTIEGVEKFYHGPPANTPRDVVDNSYSYALILHFPGKAEQDAYQVADIHKKFIEESEGFWTRVQVYDSLVK